MYSWLRAFIAVAEHGRFGTAARDLAMTQPALSKQIQTLERRLGGTLFIRGRQGARLTGFGTALLPGARELVCSLDDFVGRAHRLSSGRVGLLTVGFGLSTLDLAPGAVREFRRSFPDVEVSLEDLPSAVQADRIRSGTLHVGFVRLPVGDDLCRRILRRDHLAIASTTSPPRDVRAWLGTQRLVALARDKGPGLADQIDRLFGSWGISPDSSYETHDIQTVLALVAAGVGPALVPAGASRIAPTGVVLTPLHDDVAAWDVGVVWHRNQDTDLVQNFLAGLDIAAP